jgi:ABC-type polysaccharide/polyol phosphate export permease
MRRGAGICPLSSVISEQTDILPHVTTSLPVYDSDQLRTPLVSEFRNLWKYRGLVKLLVGRDLTVRYKRSVLGVWWTLLNPLMMTGVLYLVFGVAFPQGRFGEVGEPFILYLISGVLMITYFSQGLLATGAAITNSSDILSKVYVPSEVFAFSTAVAALANFIISLIPMFIIQAIVDVSDGGDGSWFHFTMVLGPIPVLAMLALVTGGGMIIAAAAVWFYDVLSLMGVVVQLLYYLSPVFYDVSFVGGAESFAGRVITANPLFSYLEVFRDVMYRGVVSPLWQWGMILGSAAVFLVAGVWVFSKAWRGLVAQL